MITDEASNLSGTQPEDEPNGSVSEKLNDSASNHLESSSLSPSASNFQKELDDLKNHYEQKLKQQQLDSNRKENILIMRLTLKEQELQDCLAQIEALKNCRSPSNHQLESFLLDPALNYIFEKMKKEVDTARTRVEEMQNEMNAWKFSSDSITGKQLMAKCRQLHQENEDLGKMITSGKIAKLESGLAMHKNYSESLTKSQNDFEEVVNEMEENVEGYQNTVYQEQQQLKQLKEKYEKILQILKQCKCECKNEIDSDDFQSSYEIN